MSTNVDVRLDRSFFSPVSRASVDRTTVLVFQTFLEIEAVGADCIKFRDAAQVSPETERGAS